MYLSDREIHTLLPELNIQTDSPDHVFSEAEQIQPCSIDIRLSNVFWIPTRSQAVIDLRRSSLVEVSPRRHWKRLALNPHECRTIQPGETVYARTYEKFTVPETCAAKIEGRSSFARMGLAIHSTGDFINPGWRGHMPLQITNNGPHKIKLFPYIPICQLILIAVSSRPIRVYGSPELGSKYMDDDGGPSFWWRDKRIKALQLSLGKHDVGTAIQHQILGTIGIQEPEILERFESYVDRMPRSDFDNAHTALDNFSKSEDRQRTLDKLVRWGQAVPFGLLGGISVKLLFDPIFFWYYYVIWAVGFASAFMAARVFTMTEDSYLGEKELRKLTTEKPEVTPEEEGEEPRLLKE